MTLRASMASPLGPITVVESEGLITALEWCGGGQDETPLLNAARDQLAEYLAGRRRSFDLPLDFGGGFQGRLRRALAAIPYGETRTYGELARRLAAPAQAVGQACGANPIPILIPCHRVLAAGGLGGFSAKGGIETKVFLLKLEGAASLLL